MDISALKRDSKSIEAGKWVEGIPGLENARLCVRGFSSEIVVTRRAAKERIVSKKGRNADGSLKPTIARRVLGEVLHEVVLLDWDGFTHEGKPVPYDVELAKEWCTNPDFEHFADAVTWAALSVDRGITDLVEDVGGNSKRSSSGSTSGATEQKN